LTRPTPFSIAGIVIMNSCTSKQEKIGHSLKEQNGHSVWAF